jgi:hypothetical protein
VAQEGFEPSASLVLSESGLPVAYRASQFRGLESNQRLHVQSVVLLPAATAPESVREFGKKDSNLHHLIQSQAACQLADSRERLAGVEPACQAWEARAWPLGQRRFLLIDQGISRAGSGNRTPVAWLEARSRTARPIPQ